MNDRQDIGRNSDVMKCGPFLHAKQLCCESIVLDKEHQWRILLFIETQRTNGHTEYKDGVEGSHISHVKNI